MTTIEATNYAVSCPIHRAGSHLRTKSTQTSYVAQFSHKPQRYYAKQTQFAQCSNKRKCCTNKALSKYSTLQKPVKQTQFQTHRPTIAQPIINMQNKPNLRRHIMNVTAYGQEDYRNLRLPEPRQNKPNPNSRPVALPVRCSGDGIAYFHVSNLVFRASNLFRISIFLISCFHPIYAKQTQFPKAQNERKHL